MELNEFKKRQFILICLSSLIITWIICFSFDFRDAGRLFFTFSIVALAQLFCLHVTINDLVRGSQVSEPTIERNEIDDYEQGDVKPKKVTKDQYFYFPYVNGLAIVLKETFHYDGSCEKAYSFIDKKGKYITQKWYRDVMDFNEYGVAIVCDGTAYNIIDREGNELSINWFNGIVPFSDGMAKVRWVDGTVNYIDTTGKLAWSEWKEDTPSILSVSENENIEEE